MFVCVRKQSTAKYKITNGSENRYISGLHRLTEDVHFEANCFNFEFQIAIIFRLTKKRIYFCLYKVAITCHHYCWSQELYIRN